MASEITVKFEFEIGELVYIKGAQHCEGARPRRFVITERLAQQCHADMQRLYRLEGYDNRGYGVPEVALTREEPLYQNKSNEENLEHFHFSQNWSDVRDFLREEAKQNADDAGSEAEGGQDGD